MANVLFVCVHNAGRSQMAKAIFNRVARQRGLGHVAESAGTEPAGHVHANVVEASRELGVDVADAAPRLLSNEMIEAADRVITMGCAIDSDACPALFLTDHADWGLPNPKDQPPEQVRTIRDEIGRRVGELLDSLA